jgi:hypothetical protein
MSKFPKQLDALRLWDSSPISGGLRRRLLRVYAHYQFLSEQVAELEATRRALLQSSPEASVEQVRPLMQLKGVEINGSWLLVMEFLAWCTFWSWGRRPGKLPDPGRSPDRAEVRCHLRHWPLAIPGQYGNASSAACRKNLFFVGWLLLFGDVPYDVNHSLPEIFEFPCEKSWLLTIERFQWCAMASLGA